MAQAPSYESLITHIQDLERRVVDTEHQLRATEVILEQQRELASHRQTQLKTLHTLNLGVFSTLEQNDIYQLACESVVRQLGWDTAFVISMTAGRGMVKAASQATEKQVQHLRDYLHQNPIITDAYAQHSSLTTFGNNDTQALALRTLFQTDEVVAHPILFGDHCYAYLVACAHTSKAKGQQIIRGMEDTDFLANMAALLAHALEQSSSFINLEEQNKKLRQLDELKDSFISITSHQLRTPLSIVKWILSILQTDKALTPFTEQTTLINQAYETNERLIHVVNDLLNVSRIQEGRMPYNPQPADLGHVLKDLAAGAERILTSKNITLEIDISPGIPPLDLDPILFKEAIQNLIDNAIDYNVENGWIKIQVRQENGTIFLVVRNPGPGVPPEELPKIFEQFYRSPQAVKLHPNGNGLGLYLAQAIISQHGGTITCTSEVNKETVFTVTLPVPVATSATEAQPVPETVSVNG